MNSILSDIFSVGPGVQGCVLSPTLFIIFNAELLLAMHQETCPFWCLIDLLRFIRRLIEWGISKLVNTIRNKSLGCIVSN